MELLIMAAGMGSRFGGLKQLEPMGPNGEFIIDYSIYDAKNAGFKKVIFIIKEENYELFKETIGKRIEKKIPVSYVFQKMEDIPSFVKKPETRIKPWGTAQAIYAARNEIKEPFVVINADDFYGRDAFLVAKNFIENHNDAYATIGYEAGKTLTENGSVKRGVLSYDENDNLISIVESSLIKEGNRVKCTSLNEEKDFYIQLDDLVSMNMLIFNPSIFKLLEDEMQIFFKENEDNLDKCEFLIPDVLNKAKDIGYAKVKVLHTKAKWFGVTYKEDTFLVKKQLNDDILRGFYSNNLW